MKSDRRNLDQAAEIGSVDIFVPPELEACLEELLPDRDPRAVYMAMRKALDELYWANCKMLN